MHFKLYCTKPTNVDLEFNFLGGKQKQHNHLLKVLA